MNSGVEEMSESLVRIFENVLLTEEKSLSRGYFSDLSLAEMHTLTAIGPYEAKTMSQTAQALGITTGTLTVSIDRLVKKGYVDRRRDDRDKRVVRISLTRTGKLACRMHSKFHRVLAKRILEPYGEEDQDRLLVLVKAIDKHVEDLLARYEGSDEKTVIRETAKEIAHIDSKNSKNSANNSKKETQDG
ncbi:DNA-binding transcriptional regulator, MarR family [Ruminococcaceae bacterium YRB3002]|nr:DNA-binding transcriptional regulator, MarR family [Ruminococcaceae bacterium YRB3002]